MLATHVCRCSLVDDANCKSSPPRARQQHSLRLYHIPTPRFSPAARRPAYSYTVTPPALASARGKSRLPALNPSCLFSFSFRAFRLLALVLACSSIQASHLDNPIVCGRCRLSSKMGRTLSGLLVLVRLVQILGSFIPGALNGWLLYYISAKKLGPSQLMLVLELLVCPGYSSALPRQPRHEQARNHETTPTTCIPRLVRVSDCIARLPPHSYTLRSPC